MSLWFAQASGADPKKFSHPAFRSNLAYGMVRFSPDGTKLGVWFEGGTHDRPREFWEIAFPGMVARRTLLTLSSLPRAYPFSWMRDGHRIVFGADFHDRLPGFHLWTADTRTGRLQPITATHGNEYYPSVSPDGRRIVFSSEDSDFDVLEVPLDGSPTRSLLATSRIEKMPVWSPDGSQFAYVTNRSGSDEIWARSADGAWERPVATKKDFPASTTFLLSDLSFSPDGKRIAYQRAAGQLRIWISNVLGGAPIPILSNERLQSDHPAWSPDGSWMAFVSYTETSNRGLPRAAVLLKVRLGSDELPIVLQKDIVVYGDVTWSPAGDWITCETVDGIMLVSPNGGPGRLLSEDSWIAHGVGERWKEHLRDPH